MNECDDTRPLFLTILLSVPPFFLVLYVPMLTDPLLPYAVPLPSEIVVRSIRLQWHTMLL